MPTNGNHGNGNGAYAPSVRLDLTSCSKTAFDEAVALLKQAGEQHKIAGTLPPMPFTRSDWYDITPAMAEAAFWHTSGNRPMVFAAVKTYAVDMIDNEWKPTAQAIGVVDDELDDGHHRLLGAYFSGSTFRAFVVCGPKFPNRFAYYDVGKKRTNADALAIAGWNGVGKVMAQTIGEIALRYDAGALGVLKQPRFRPVNPRECLRYLDSHPDFQSAARYVLSNHLDAVDAIGSKAVAAFFGWRIIQACGTPVLDDFYGPLGTGANLTEDSPILAVRKKLMVPPSDGSAMYPRTRLAYLIKAFLLHSAGQMMPRTRNGRVQALSIDLEEPFPQIPTAPAPAQTTSNP